MMVAHAPTSQRPAPQKKRSSERLAPPEEFDCALQPSSPHPYDCAFFRNDETRAKIRNLGHDLRTPLNAIIGFSEVLLSEAYGPIDNDRYRQYIDDMHRSGVEMLSLVEHLLDTACKLESGDKDVDRARRSIESAKKALSGRGRP